MITNPLQINSEQVQELALKARVQSPVWNYVWYFIGLPIIVAFSAFIAWEDITLPLKALPMVTLVCALYVCIWVSRYFSDNYLAYRAIGLSVFYSTIGLFIIFSILALGRLYYSRSFLLTSYGLIVSWSGLSTIFFRTRHQEYVILKGGLADKLKGFKKLGWKYINQLRNIDNFRNFDGIVVDLHAHDDKRVLKALADSSLHGVPVLHAATVLENYTGRVNINYFAREGLYDLEMPKAYKVVKRFWEIGLIILFLPITVTIAAIVAVAIKISTGGPILYCQERVGKDDKLFTIYKFRSMYEDAEKGEEKGKFATKEDDRITHVGKFIRKFRIDEIPQFWNVLKGEMSLIGPRPEQEGFVNLFNDEIPFYSYRHKVRPGITGWAQVKDGYASGISSTKRKLEFDLYYVKNQSLSLDFLIAYATIKTVLTGFGSR